MWRMAGRSFVGSWMRVRVVRREIAAARFSAIARSSGVPAPLARKRRMWTNAWVSWPAFSRARPA
jgi:hypothetical protein